MARTPAITGASNKLIRSMRQQQAITGNRLNPDQIRAIVSGELDVEAARSLEGARLEERKRQFDENMRLQEEAIAKQDRAAAISGGVQLASLGYQAGVINPAKIANLEAQTALTKAQTAGITGAPVVPALPGDAGLSVAGGAIPETFTSAATGEAISTATGEAVTGGAGTLGTVVGGAGAFGIGGTASSIFGEGGALQIGGGKGAEAAGIAGGIAAGAAYGSVIPGIGTVVGGVLGGVGAAAEGTVICEELHRQGLLPRKVLAYDHIYRLRYIDGETYFGYRLVAEPLVAAMRVSKIVTKIVTPFGRAWAYTMANKVNHDIKVGPVRKFVGNALLKYGAPYCLKKARGILKKNEGGLIHG